MICFDKEGNINEGFVFSKLNPHQINHACRTELIKRLQKELPRESLEHIIELYKNSDNYDENTTDLEGDAIYEYADNLLKEMDEFSKKELIDKVVLENNKFVLSNSDNGINVSVLFGNQNISSFIAEEQVLIDRKGLGLYNQLYSELKQHSNVGNIESKSVNLDYDNGLVFNKDNNTNYRVYVLSYLHRNVCQAIEKLIKNKNNIENFEYQLKELLEKRDNYQSKIDATISANKKVM